MYDEQCYEKCLLIDGRSVCCGFAASKNIKSLGMNIKYLKKKTSSFLCGIWSNIILYIYIYSTNNEKQKIFHTLQFLCEYY